MTTQCTPGSSTAIVWHGLAVFSVAVWGTTFISTKYLLDYLTPLEILLYRSMIAYAVLFALRPRIQLPTRLGTESVYFAAGVFGITLYFVFENNALRWTYASNASLIVCVAPVLSALLSPLARRPERFAQRTLVACLVALAGVGLVVTNGSLVLNLNPFGDFLAFLSALAWALFPIALSRIDDAVENIIKMRKVFFYGLATTIIYMTLSGEEIYNKNCIAASVGANLLFLGLIASALCYVIWNQAVAHLGVSNTMIYMYFVPVVTVVAGTILLHEQITLLMLFGGGLILTGVAINNVKSKTRIAQQQIGVGVKGAE